MTKQIPTATVSIETIMQSPLFEAGVRDARAGRGFPLNYDELDDPLWAYERGRQWAGLVPRSVPVKVNGKVTREAIAWFRRVGSAIP